MKEINRCALLSNLNQNEIKPILQLQRRQERERTGTFFVDGMRFVAQAVEHAAPLETVVAAPELLTHPFGRRLARHLKRAGTRCLEVTAEVYHSLSLAEEPQGIGAVVRQQWTPLKAARPRQGLCWVALDRVQSPGNLGTIIRTCDAVGAAGVILIGGAIDPYDPAAVRASMGALFSQRFVRANAPEFAAWRQRHSCLLVGASPGAAADYRSVAYHSPLILWMGNERQGLSPEQQILCDKLTRIPMVGRSDSLNLAVATGVMLYEIFAQCHRMSGQKRGRRMAGEGQM